MEIRRLRETDRLDGFDSGDPDLDRFLLKYAALNQFELHIGVTYVAVEGDEVLGFATVAPAHIEVEGLPEKAQARLPAYPVPVLRLARLAVDGPRQEEGIGTSLLRAVFLLALAMAERVGCAGVLVDAKPDAVAFYDGLGFMRLDAVSGASPARPQPTPMLLALEDVRWALEG
jgi:GNAT superfamily N-acetyltransferase